MSKKKRRRFADCIIVLCLIMSTVITADILIEYHILGEVIPSGVLSALLGFWGGELMLIAVRQIFGSDVVGKAKQINTEDTGI